jgi:ribosomal 50S subunit-recycling heat shock protein
MNVLQIQERPQDQYGNSRVRTMDNFLMKDFDELSTLMSAGAASVGVRLDVWLWAVRFFKTRALAKCTIEVGKVRIGDALGKPSKLAHIGNRLAVMRGEYRYEVKDRPLSCPRF